MKLSMIIAVALSALSLHSALADDDTHLAAERIAVGTCATCHGPLGRSTTPKFPVLAGQQENYLIAQLQAFKSQTRGDADALGYMWGMAAPLDDAAISSLADYYSKQKPDNFSARNSAAIIHGRDLYQNGNTDEGIPACVACHGANAAGNESFPRLAGQHSQYLIKQLRSFQNNMRNVAVMHGVAQGLKKEEMESIAAYLQSLP